MSFEIRPIVDAEVARFRRALALGFGIDPSGEGSDDRFRSLMPLERTVAVFDGDQIVGTLGDFDLRLFVPGGATLAAAGTTMVTVRSTHRRQGILRSMMRRHLDNAVERGEPVAALWASEPAIYGRFGFGLASEHHDVTIDTRRATVPPPAEDLRAELIEPDQLEQLVAPLWSRVATRRAGFIDRDHDRWVDIACDPEFKRTGSSSLRSVVIRRGADVVGYVSYRQTEKWDDGVPGGTVKVEDLVAADAQAQHALWHYITAIDLFPKVHFWNAAVDDPVALVSGDMRSVRRLLTDGLYVRLLDLDSALGARTYECDGALTLQVADAMGHVAGTWRLTVSDGVATVESPTDAAAPDVALDARDLAALYLGGTRATTLADAGRITGPPEAIDRLDRIFRTARAPWCPEMF